MSSLYTLGLWRGVFPKSARISWPRRPSAQNVASSSRMESTSSTGQSQYKSKKDSLLSPTMILLGIMPIFTFALGTWQVERLKWKVKLIDELQEKLQRDPLSLPRRINLSAVADFTYRKVIIRGKWDHAHAMLLGPRVYDGTNGYHLIEPLVRIDGTTVIVDRGFISQDLVDRKAYLQDSSEVEVLGMLRTGHVRNRFTPDNHPEQGKWYWADIETMAQYAGGEQASVQSVFIEEIFEGHAGDAAWRVSHGIPLGRPPSIDVRNSHASYIVTWYSLSVFTTTMFVRLLLKQRRARARLPR